MLQKEIKRLLATARRKRGAAADRQGKTARAVRALRDRFESLERIDFFGTVARDETAAVLADLERKVAGPEPTRAKASSGSRKAQFQGRRWVTRAASRRLARRSGFR